MSANPRNKGHGYERKIAQFYRDQGYEDIRRGSQSHGGKEPDVVGTPWWVECAHYTKGGLVFRKMRQAVRDIMASSAWRHHHAVIHVHETNGPDLVVLTLEHWRRLIHEIR